jgi:hypothetical protein
MAHRYSTRAERDASAGRDRSARLARRTVISGSSLKAGWLKRWFCKGTKKVHVCGAVRGVSECVRLRMGEPEPLAG